MRYKSYVIPYFFFSQALADGLRITFSILAPILFFRHIGYFETGLAISLGAVCVNITDIPGPIRHKRNGLIAACVVVFLASLLSGLFHIHLIITGIIVCVATFICSMCAIYGVRVATIGSAGLLVLILSLSSDSTPFSEVLFRSSLIFIGALWYSGISLLLTTMRPYRMAQRALGECLRETSKYLSLKGAFYDPKTKLKKNYKKLLAQQIIVNEKQHEVRELLYKTRQIVKDTSGTGRSLMLTFVDTIDLYEKITASYYDYDSIRKKYSNTGVLKKIAYLIKRLSYELNAMGFAIQSNSTYKKDHLLYAWILDFKHYTSNIVHIENKEDEIVLKRITDNLEDIYNRIQELGNYFESEKAESPFRKILHKPFVDTQEYSVELFKDNLTFQSSAFRHAIRVTIACLVGFITAQLMNYGHHSYWILITIVFIMKPAFSLTKKRNLERLIGTAGGGIIGLAILYFFPDPKVQFACLLFLMIGTYTFMRINYVVMVIFTTPYVLIMLKLLGSGYMSVIQERLVDTGIGCTIALAAGYLLFPKWEADELEDHLQHVIKSNLNYLRNFALLLSGNSPNVVDYKLARKEVFVSSANLSAAFQRMLSEPRKKQKNSDKVYEFVVLNHVLSSNIAGLTADTNGETLKECSEEELVLLNQIQLVLFDCLNSRSGMNAPDDTFLTTELERKEKPDLKAQLEFILRLCNDIYRAKKLIRT
ncbi:MAG: hypothetical protein K0S44_2213 [Bacteroidetes bacterium]|jgi:uncharacterized membrane protein (TIGR01666 family)|nr:hypothetical protein [Bacteroidota bacterium]